VANKTVNGTNFSETLWGSEDSDFFQPYSGDDIIYGGGGNDEINAYYNDEKGRLFFPIDGTLTVYAGAGNDLIGGKSGNDVIYGQEGDDYVWSREGNDLIEGGPGDDHLDGDDGDDTLDGGTGDDFLRGGAGNDTLKGGVGNDEILSENGNDTIYGGDGDDRINGFLNDTEGNKTSNTESWSKEYYLEQSFTRSSYFSADPLLIYGGPGNDIAAGGQRDDIIFGDEGNDILSGNDGDDKIEGGLGQDYLVGGMGNDTLLGGDGDDYLTVYSYAGANSLFGGNGDDDLYGGEGNDLLQGGDGNDYLDGNGGNDRLQGGDGDDKLYGSAGNDTLEGGLGYDYLYGGSGNDTYIIRDGKFDIYDEGGEDTAEVYTSFVKIPSEIETVNYHDGALPLPYWISALIPDWGNGTRYANFLGDAKTFGYSFPNTAPGYLTDEEDLLGFKGFTAVQQANTRELLSYIETIIDVQFEFTDNPSGTNIILFALNTGRENAGGYASFPSESADGSDIFLKHKTGLTLSVGTWGATAITHEVGHALGLKHPFEAPSPSGLVADPPYLPDAEDTSRWAQMSYEDEAGFDSYVLEFSPLDIAALQFIYGPSKKSASTGDDTYIFDSAAPNFIWDSGGTDTIDASTSPDSVTIFLEPGYQGFKGLDKMARLITAPGQITVNFGTEIENLVGSKFSDVLTGNDLSNRISGLSGTNVIDGKGGIDFAIFTEESEDYEITPFDGHWLVSSETENSQVIDIERLIFSNKNIALDLDGNAGLAVKAVGAFWGAESVKNPEVVGKYLKRLDENISFEALLEEVVQEVFEGSKTGAQMVDHFYDAVVGGTAPEDISSHYGALVDSGQLSAVGLASLVSNHEINVAGIDLIGLADTGIEYII
tara:strand:+ start:39768 stop:42404 length:2637 start_codon:yes stop_codon:yes gene_type:complete